MSTIFLNVGYRVLSHSSSSQREQVTDEGDLNWPSHRLEDQSFLVSHPQQFLISSSQFFKDESLFIRTQNSEHQKLFI